MELQNFMADVLRNKEGTIRFPMAKKCSQVSLILFLCESLYIYTSLPLPICPRFSETP